MPSPAARISQLDGLRGFAILLVLIWHDVFGLIETTPGSPAAYALRALSLTWAGVDLFFVLSGFLIGGILLAQRDSATYFRTFYIRRACRIFPLYYVVLLLFVLGGALVPPSGTPWQRWLFDSPAPLWSYATYLQNLHMAQWGFGANWLAPTWSLAVEEQFYLLMPLLIWWLSPAALTRLLVAAVVLTPLCRVGLQLWFGPHNFAAYVLLPARWDSLFLGVLAAVAWRQPALEASIRRAVPTIRIGLAVGLIGVVLLILTGQNIGTWGMTSAGYSLIAACGLATVLLAMASDDGVVQRLFRSRALVWLGTVSYGVYLFHRPITGLVHGLLLDQAPRIRNLHDVVVTAVAWACTLALAEASARWFERPIVNAGHRWARY